MKDTSVIKEKITIETANSRFDLVLRDGEYHVENIQGLISEELSSIEAIAKVYNNNLKRTLGDTGLIFILDNKHKDFLGKWLIELANELNAKVKHVNKGEYKNEILSLRKRNSSSVVVTDFCLSMNFLKTINNKSEGKIKAISISPHRASGHFNPIRQTASLKGNMKDLIDSLLHSTHWSAYTYPNFITEHKGVFLSTKIDICDSWASTIDLNGTSLLKCVLKDFNESYNLSFFTRRIDGNSAVTLPKTPVFLNNKSQTSFLEMRFKGDFKSVLYTIKANTRFIVEDNLLSLSDRLKEETIDKIRQHKQLSLKMIKGKLYLVNRNTGIAMNINNSSLPEDTLINKIYFIRNDKVYNAHNGLMIKLSNRNKNSEDENVEALLDVILTENKYSIFTKDEQFLIIQPSGLAKVVTKYNLLEEAFFIFALGLKGKYASTKEIKEDIILERSKNKLLIKVKDKTTIIKTIEGIKKEA